MRESATPGDMQYLLRHLDHTIFRFRVKLKAHSPIDSVEQAVIDYLQSHPGATVNAVRADVPPLPEESYSYARDLLARMVDAGVLELDGQSPLEEVDGRYERVPSCDLCGAPSDGHTIVLWKHNTPVVRCSACGLLYSNPRWKAEHLFGRYTEEYWQHYTDSVRDTAFDPLLNEARWRNYLSYLDLVRQTGRLLDVGCATGEFLAAARSRGWETHGVETSRVAASRAEEIAGAQVHVGTLDTAQYPDGWFDAVTLWDVIEHVQSPSSYVARIQRLVRPGGIFALTTPNIRSVSYALLRRHWWVVGPNDHIYYFAPRTMARLLTKHDFAIHQMHTLETKPETWQQWLRYPALQWLAPILSKVATPFLNRFLLGDELFVIARRKPYK